MNDYTLGTFQESCIKKNAPDQFTNEEIQNMLSSI